MLASLNLPAAIEDVSGDTVPQSILTKSTSVIEQGGIQTVDQLIRELPELLQRNREILDEVCFKKFIFQVKTLYRFGVQQGLGLEASSSWGSEGSTPHPGEFTVAQSLLFSLKRNSD